MREVSVSVFLYKIGFTGDTSSQKALDTLPPRHSVAKYEPRQGEKIYLGARILLM